MDQSLTDLARQCVMLLSPIIAQGALSKVGEDTTDRVTALAKRAWNVLETRFQGDKKAESALMIYGDEPDDEKSQQRVAQHIAAHFTDDAARTELREIVAALQAAQPAAPTTQHTQNVTGSTVGIMLQDGDIHGNITLGPTIGGDQINAQGAQGFVNRPSGTVRQTFGTGEAEEE
jgi:hypothetical protein